METEKSGENPQKNEEKSDGAAVVLANPAEFFEKDRGERALYTDIDPNAEVLLPLTRDGFEALAERCVAQFEPALPLDDSTRKVLAQWVHRIANEKNTSSIADLAKILYKSVSNSLTWTIDQEIKTKQQKEYEAARAKAQKEFDDKQKAEAMKKAEEKRAKKADKRVPTVHKANGANKTQ